MKTVRCCFSESFLNTEAVRARKVFTKTYEIDYIVPALTGPTLDIAGFWFQLVPGSQPQRVAKKEHHFSVRVGSTLTGQVEGKGHLAQRIKRCVRDSFVRASAETIIL
jgi:hypothetical protein